MTPEETLDESRKRNSLDVQLAEYEMLREEIQSRLDTQRQAFNYTVAVLGGIVAVAGILAGQGGDGPNLLLLPHLALLLPLIIGPLAFIFFDDELVIYRNIFHICLHLRGEVSARLGKTYTPFRVEADGFDRMYATSRLVHPFLSAGRWLLFILPVAAPLVIYAETPDGLRAAPVRVGDFTVQLSYYSDIVFWVDVAVAALLLWAIVSVLYEQHTWRTKLRPGA